MRQWQRRLGRLAVAAFVVAAVAGSVVEFRHVARAEGSLLLEDSHAPSPTRATPRPPAPRTVIPTPSAPGPVVYLGELGQMAAGTQIIFLDRLEMFQGQPFQVRAFVTLDLEAAAPDPTTTGLDEDFTAGHLISARLTEKCSAECSFQINTPADPERRIVLETPDPEGAQPDDILEWTWEVIPLESGRFSLVLDVESVAFIDLSNESLRSQAPVAFERTATVVVDSNPGFEMLDEHADLGRYTVLIESASMQTPHVIEVGDSFVLTASRGELASPPRSFQSAVELAADDATVAQIQRAGPRRGEVVEGRRVWSWTIRGLQAGTTDLILTVDATLDVAGEVREARDELAVELLVSGRPAAAVLDEGFDAGSWIIALAVGGATVVAGMAAVGLIRRRMGSWRLVAGPGSDEEGSGA